MRAVLDPNVVISALVSKNGAPAELVSCWLAGEFEIVVSELLLDELDRALGYPKLRARISPSDAAEFLALLRDAAFVAPDPPRTPRRSPNPGDDYLLGLAEAERAILVSGDQHLLGLAGRFPIHTARTFLETLEADRATHG